jgi:iron complex outermembrane recepter protein
MNEYRGRYALTVAGAVALALAAAAAGAEISDTTNLNEVVVTAQKRTEALADIPMSVSVVAGDTLERARATDFQDLAALIPGLSINSSTPGVSRVTLRGINTGGVASTVGVYVNDVPFGSSSGLANGAILSGDFDTFDLARVEVLRGPQGTLYGASSLGGVIKYVANEPSTDGFEGRVQASAEDVSGGDLGYSMTGVVNMPAGDTFAARVSAFYREDGGYVDSIGNNPIPSLQNPAVNIVDGSRIDKELNGFQTAGGRFSAVLKPSEDFSVNFTALIQNINSANSNAYEADPVTFKPLYGDLVASRYHPEYTDTQYRVYSATVDWDMGPFTLQSVTSYGEFSETFQRDYAIRLSLAQLLTLIFSDPVTAQPPLSAILNQVTSTDKFTQELRLVSPQSDSFEWLLGGYYTNEHSGINPQTISAVLAGTEDPLSGFPALAVAKLNSQYEEKALFANATWHFSDRFDLSFGGRWSQNDQKASQSLDGLLVGGLTTYDEVKSSESPFTWSVSPRYEFTDKTSAYLRVATGFRPGGPNVLPPGAPPGTPMSYDSDKLTNYELGLRTESASGTFSLDVAAYFLDWQDIQLFAQVNNVGINANGGTAESKGLEFTAAMRATKGLTLALTGAYTDAFITEDTDPLVGGVDGDPLPWVPDYSLALSGDYEWDVFSNSTAYIGGQVAYVGNRTADFSNRDANGRIREADAYTTFDLRTGLLLGKLSIELYGQNLTDERGITDILPEGSYPNGAVGIGTIRPRTIGLSLGMRF